jgi:hypothetical protein
MARSTTDDAYEGKRGEAVGLLVMRTIIFLLVMSAAAIQQSVAAPASDAASAQSTSAATLLQLRESLRSRMANSPFKVPLMIESRQSDDDIKGEVYAEINHSFKTVSAALGSPRAWCDILILHLNTKSCALQPGVDGSTTSPTLMMTVGKKVKEAPESAYPIALMWKTSQSKADFLQVDLAADVGPLNTRNYRIVLEAAPTENGNTFIHLSYSYGFGTTAKFLMKAYLNTIGRNKVGFTVIGKKANGEPIYVEGLLGLVERNTMRYHLAVEAYLGAMRTPEPMQFEKRIGDWFQASERYAQQLHEVNLGEYLDMKRVQYRRKQ